MEINFVKMQSGVSDYVLLDGSKNRLPQNERLSHFSRQITDRHYGVGGYGVAFIMPTNESAVRTNDGVVSLRIFNNRGIEEKIDTQAIRCAGRLAFDSGLVLKSRFEVKVPESKFKLTVIDSTMLRIDMGLAYFDDNKELIENPEIDFTRSFIMEKKEYTYTPVMLNEIHAVLFVPDYQFNLNKLSRKIDHKAGLPENSILEFVSVYSRDEISIRIWEKKSAEMASFDSGASASVIASVLNGFTDREVFVHLKGGNNFIEWSETDNHIYLSAPVNYIFSGVYYYEDESDY